MGDIVFPTSNVSDYSIVVQRVAATKYTNEKKATKNLILAVLANFLVTSTEDLKRARAHNKDTLRNLN